MDPLQEAQSLLDGGYAAEALAAVERVPTSAASTLLRARAELALDRFDHAHATLRSVFRRDDVPPKHRAHAQILQATLLRRSSPLLDEALDSALRGAAGAMRAGDPGLAAEAHVEAARLLATKRSRELADAQLARAIERAGGIQAMAGALACAQAEIRLAFDDRPGALELYAQAAAPGAPCERQAHVGSANVAMLLGHFDEAHGHLSALGPLRSGEALARRLRVRLLLAAHRWAEAAHVIEEGLHQNAASDFRFRDRHERACALYRAGFFVHAKAAFEELAAVPNETSRWIDLAKRTARLLSRPDIGQRRWYRLQTFPTVAQLRSHCGPAACELYLRYFGVPASQLEIARAIKEPDGGTPMYRMRSLLEQAGFHTRRVEAELPILRRLIECQLPVIMEEDYSSSGHVAVAIGYDDIRDVLEVQDPMSHEIRETPYEDLARLRDLSNHGALVAVPRSDAARVAQLDAIGAVECRYMSLVDEAWAAYDAGQPEHGDGLAEQSIALRRDYEIARFYQFQRAIEIARKTPTPDTKLRVHQVVSEVVAIWPDDAWPHRLRGEALAGEARYSEALASFQRSRERDKLDPRTWASIAMCEMALGRDDDAYGTLKEALRLDPSHPGANGRLALLALDRGEVDRAEVLNEVARRRAPKVAYHHWVHARILLKRGRDADALAAFDRSLELDPKRAGTRVERAACLAKLGRVDDGAAYLEKTIAELPDEKFLRLELARLLYDNARYDRAIATCRAILETEKNGGAQSVLAAALLASGAPEADGAAAQVFAVRPTDGWLYAQIGKHAEKRGDHAAAIRAFATALGLRQNDAQSELDLGFALAAGGYAPQGAPYLFRSGQKLDLGEDPLYRVGEVLVDAGGSARPFFERVLERRQDDPQALRAHARIMLELCWAPSLGESSLARLARVAPDDAYARAWRGAQMMDTSLDKEADGERLLREAIGLIPTREYPRRALGERLFARGRCDEALALVEPCELRHQVSRLRVRALSSLLRFDDADEEIERFDTKWGKGGKPSYGARSLRFERLLACGDYASVIVLAEQLGREDGEREDDGRLDFWETVKFECLARLGEGERALRFGERQALDGPSLARLILLAYDVGQLGVAQALAERALRLFPDLLAAQFVTARLAELRGEDARAAGTYRDLQKRDASWHRPHLAIARSALANGDLVTAASSSQLGVRAGHLYPESFVVRGQARAMGGDRTGGLSDLERAYGMMRADARARDHLDAWALRAQLSGDRNAADMLFQKYLAGATGAADKLRVQRLRVV